MDQKEIYDSELEFIIRNKDEIDEFLYEFNSSHMKRENGSTFDHTDIIFIIGSSGLLPWLPAAQKVLALLRMCLKTNKIVFVSGDSMQCLVFLCASDLEKNINIINGKGYGGKLSEIFKTHKDLSRLELNDFFLDNVTGDLYHFNRESEEWHPKGNVGLHHRRSAEEYQTLGKYIVKAPIYRPKKINELVEIYKAKTTETIIYIKKNYMNHWCVKGIYPFEFKAQLLGEWDCHTFSFVNKDKMFVSLGDSERGPAILDFGNILALHFNVEKTYSPTIPIVKNFIDRSIDIMKANKMNSVKKILETFPKSQMVDIINFNPNKFLKKTRVRESIKYENNEVPMVAKHVGFSYAKNKFPQIIANNAVTLDLSVPKLLKKNVKDSPLYQNSAYSSPPKYPEKSLTMKTNLETTKDFEEKEENVLSKKKIRTFLHPTLSNDHLKDETMWIPGNLSQTFYKKIILKRGVPDNENTRPYFNTTFNKSTFKY